MKEVYDKKLAAMDLQTQPEKQRRLKLCVGNLLLELAKLDNLHGPINTPYTAACGKSEGRATDRGRYPHQVLVVSAKPSKGILLFHVYYILTETIVRGRTERCCP